MKANVTRDDTFRTIQIDVEPGSVPDIDVTRPYHHKPRIFRPDHVTLKVVNGERSSLKVSGGLVLKSGAASAEVREDQEYRRESYHDYDNISHAPEWVCALWSSAPEGVVLWGLDSEL